MGKVMHGHFEWDLNKERFNVDKHGVDFITATMVFYDMKRIVVTDEMHSSNEQRFFCIGRVGKKILTVRFTYRNNLIRIIGAGFWRKGSKYYEKENG